MPLFAGQLLVPLMVTLLAMTTPVGTGAGVHQDQLLHPVFAHTHVVDGRIVTDEQLAAARAAAAKELKANQPTRGPGWALVAASMQRGQGLPSAQRCR